MPSLPIVSPVVPGSVDRPIKSVDDVKALFPRLAQGEATAPIRVAIAEAIAATQQRHQTKAEYGAAQSDVTRATGLYLDGQMADRGQARQPDEADDDETFRARGLSAPEVVSSTAVLDAANRVLARYTTIKAQIVHPILDRWFVGVGARPYAFITKDKAVDPEYVDRRYPQHDGHRPGGAWTFKDTAPGRFFVLRVPVLFGLTGTYVYSGALDERVVNGPKGAFIGTGAHSNGASFFSNGAEPAVAIYQTIANAVTSILAQSIRWELYADPLLVA